jgi:putative DNA primase/helicase
MLGDYAFSAEADLLLAVGHERHSTGVADLHGRRMVIVQEIDEGRRLDEALVKRLTGGDAITARRMRQDNFMFEPSHKLWMAANHKPVVRGTDHAIWRRIRLIPFLATVADADKDPNLVTSLLAEAPGILNWALAGCAEWRSGGLRAPEVVTDATAGYRNEQDHVGRFLEACCTLEPTLRISTKDLRATYEKWCFEEGERPWSAQAMAAQLQDRGLVQIRANGGARTRMWEGLALAGDDTRTWTERQFDYSTFDSRVVVTPPLGVEEPF